MRVLERELSGK